MIEKQKSVLEIWLIFNNNSTIVPPFKYACCCTLKFVKKIRMCIIHFFIVNQKTDEIFETLIQLTVGRRMLTGKG